MTTTTTIQTADIELGQKLRTAREAAGLSQTKAARHMQMSQPALSASEKGQRRVRAEEMMRFSILYGRDITTIAEEMLLPPLPALEARKRVLRRVLQLAPDSVTDCALQALQVPSSELERLIATALQVLIDREEATS